MSEEKLEKILDSVQELKTDVAVIKETQAEHSRRFDQHDIRTNEKVDEIKKLVKEKSTESEDRLKEVKSNIRWGVAIAMAIVGAFWALFAYLDSKASRDSQITATINLKGNVTDVAKAD